MNPHTVSQTGGGDLDSRRGSDGVDCVNSTGSAVVLTVDLSAVQREDEGQGVGQRKSQQEEEDWDQLEHEEMLEPLWCSTAVTQTGLTFGPIRNNITALSRLC